MLSAAAAAVGASISVTSCRRHAPRCGPQVQFVQYGPAWLALVLQLLPSFGLYRGLWELAQYAFLADANNGSGGVTLAAASSLAHTIITGAGPHRCMSQAQPSPPPAAVHSSTCHCLLQA